MQKRKRNRLISIIVLLTICSSGVYLILSNLQDNIVFFYPPSEIAKISDRSQKVRVGGMVKVSSIKQISEDEIKFIITDFNAELQISYKGILPTLFREKQGIVAEGHLVSDNLFVAKKLLAKHDENYMPPEIKQNMKE
ncbi:MAG: cytochrome c maturation protein CcmE [Rickettsiaceae bacterium]|nr:cytochrome c maturation protein CcmE [Rickettsiaceae bacterium]